MFDKDYMAESSWLRFLSSKNQEYREPAGNKDTSYGLSIKLSECASIGALITWCNGRLCPWHNCIFFQGQELFLFHLCIPGIQHNV